MLIVFDGRKHYVIDDKYRKLLKSYKDEPKKEVETVNIEKGVSGSARLTRKVIFDKNGKRTTVWVRYGEDHITEKERFYPVDQINEDENDKKEWDEKNQKELHKIAGERGLSISPKMIITWLAKDPNSPRQATWLDVAGRDQPVYLKNKIDKQSKEKFAKLAIIEKALPKFEKKIMSDLKKHVKEAQVMYVMIKTAMRIGTDRDLNAKQKAYGLTTITGKHITEVKDGKVEFDFIAKMGKRWNKSYSDPIIHSIIGSIKLVEDKPIFGVTAAKIRKYCTNIHPGIDPKDFRMLFACTKALEMVRQLPEMPNETKKKKAIVEILKKIGDMVNDTPGVVRKSYVNPTIWDEIKVSGTSIKVKRTAIKDKPKRKAIKSDGGNNV
jgi:DNA topoisomerase I